MQIHLGKPSKISDINASPLIGRQFQDIGSPYYATVLWHEACGGTWPADADIITYVWNDDGNMTTTFTISFKDFLTSFKLPPLDVIKDAFKAVEIQKAKVIL